MHLYEYIHVATHAVLVLFRALPLPTIDDCLSSNWHGPGEPGLAAESSECLLCSLLV